MISKLFAMALLIAGTVIGVLTFRDFSISIGTKKPTALEVHLEQTRTSQRELIPYLASVGRIHLVHRDKRVRTEKLKTSLSRAFPQSKDGKYLLEAETITTGPQDQELIIQFSLFDLQSKNKVGEFSTVVENSWL